MQFKYFFFKAQNICMIHDCISNIKYECVHLNQILKKCTTMKYVNENIKHN